MKNALLMLIVATVCVTSPVCVFAADEPSPQWVWIRDSIAEPRGRETVIVGRIVELQEPAERATVTISADNNYELFINGVRVGGDGDWKTLERYDVTALMKAGRNVVLAIAENTDQGAGGPAAVAIEMQIDGRRIVTDSSWRCTTKRPRNLAHVDPAAKSWKPVVLLGKLHEAGPWGKLKAPDEAAVAKAPPPAADISQPFELKDGDRVLLIGSEFTEQRIEHNDLEAMLTARWPERRVTFRNLGWSGDTPTGIARGYFGGAGEGYRRLIREVQRLQPTVVFVEYGSNSAHQGKDHINTFMQQLERLIVDLRAHTNRIIVVSPPPAEAKPAPLPPVDALNANRQAYTQALGEYAAGKNLRFVNLFEPLSKVAEPVTYDTIRYNGRGYELAAQAMLEALRVEAPSLDSEPARRLRDLIAAKNDLYFHRYRPQNETYLRGFRKHEQGQNAAEIQQFDALIEQAEARIAALVQGEPLPEPPKAMQAKPRTVDALDPEDERKQLNLPDGFEVNLFAAEPMVKNPIHMSFDAKGRLWVATSPIYPHILPGAEPSDEIIVLTDTDGDGRADQRTVFADDLLIPTAVLPDDRGGAYVANSTELIHLSDTDGDGKADQRRIIMAGFGTEDTHHILHTFDWGPDGNLYFNQSIYIHTHAETPHGVERLMGSGIWRLRTDTLKADVVSRGLVNPWGHVFDRWGQSFATDGAGGEGINYTFRGSAYPTAKGYRRVLHGLNPGQPKHCGLVVVSGRQFPDAWQGDLVTSDFRGNRINRFRLEAQNSGYISKQQGDLVTSKHRAFRPVDLKMGPDGAMYLADWYNPIINHGEVDFRDPRRDTEHGRIWRITRKDQPALQRPDFEGATIEQLVDMLGAPEQYTRDTARRQLALRDPAKVADALDRWVDQLDANSETFEHDRLEALWAYQTIRKINAKLLTAVLSSPDHRARAAAVRVLDDWGPQLSNGLELLADAADDEHPQVRLEAVNTARYFDNARAAEIAAGVLDHAMDKWLDFALWETMRRLEPRWMPKFLAGELAFGNDPKKIAFAVRAVENPAAIGPMIDLLASGKLDANTRRTAYQLLGEMGQPPQLRLAFDRLLEHPGERDAALSALLHASIHRGKKPAGDLSRISELLDDRRAVELAGHWGVGSAKAHITKLAVSPQTPDALRRSAFKALAAYGDTQTLSQIAGGALPLAARRDAVVTLADNHPQVAAGPAAKLLSSPEAEPITESIVNAFLGHKNGPDALAGALKDKTIPASIATLGLRRATTAGDKAKNLASVFSASAEAATMPQKLSEQQIAQLIQDVEAHGDPARGESVYRRQQLACMTCHAIAGGGGKIGPDLVSLGASAPVDYIIESLLEPSKKIKEGYHTISVITKDGSAVSGTLVREGGGSIVVRDGTGKEIEIADGRIQQKVVVPVSLMPAGLTASLKRHEFVDLVAFMAALGKEGDFKAPSNAYIRKWSIDDQPIYSRVDGSLPADAIRGKTVRFTIDVTAPGTIELRLNDTSAVRVTRDGHAENIRAERMRLTLSEGRHTLAIDVRKGRQVPLRVEVAEVEGSAGRATPVHE